MQWIKIKRFGIKKDTHEIRECPFFDTTIVEREGKYCFGKDYDTLRLAKEAVYAILQKDCLKAKMAMSFKELKAIQSIYIYCEYNAAKIEDGYHNRLWENGTCYGWIEGKHTRNSRYAIRFSQYTDLDTLEKTALKLVKRQADKILLAIKTNNIHTTRWH